MPTLQLEVSHEVARIIEEKVASGSFKSAGLFVSDAVLWLAEPRPHEDEERQLAELRAAIQRGIDQADHGEAAPYPFEQMMAETANDHD
jgi:Arc/MetJ-type ribon-helix-helix transcriptional regulator